MPLSKKHPTQRSSELTALQINPQQSKRNPLKSRPANTCMHKTGFHWQYFDKSRFITKKNTKQSLQHTKTTAFFLFLPKNLDKSQYGTLKAISRTDTLRLSKKTSILSRYSFQSVQIRQICKKKTIQYNMFI